jgi:hypothetical protein
MKTPSVYLAHPIDDHDGEHDRMFDQAATLLLRAKVAVFRPARAWDIAPGTEPSPVVQRINELALLQCSGLLAVLPPNQRTIGTVLEMSLAARILTPVAVWAPGLGQSWSLAGLDVTTFEKADLAVNWLRQQMESRQKNAEAKGEE